MSIEIRSARTREEMHACVDLQVAVWGFPERDAVPFNQLHAAHHWGGQVHVALDGERVIGFAYAFAGWQYGRPSLCSHMLAVLPDYRGQDLGAELKLAQGRWARALGYDLVTWTYDPLEAVNASLNISRLGGIVRQYLPNHYGEMTDALNRGLPTDRCLLEWHLNAPRVAAILDGQTPPAPPAPVASVAIPRSFQAIKMADPREAIRWRLRVREEIEAALKQGLIVTGFQRDAERPAYLLSREA
jgi:predicted GNAT superfamily acetyltransferase